MIIPAPNDVAFNLLGLPVYWYGVTMALAIFVAMMLANSLFNKINPDLKKDTIIEFAPYIIIVGILGARLYFCILNAQYYFTHPLEILDIREGGLSIHGAILGGVLSMIAIAKRIKIPVMSLVDAISCTTILGQSIGRWGNYFNSEAYGLPVAGQKWGLFVPLSKRISEYSDYSLFHPTFLYESILDFLAFGILLFVYLKFGNKFRGITFFVYLIIYSVIRFFIEQIRIDSALNFGTVPVAELVAGVLFVVGVIGVCVTLFQKSFNK